MSDEGKQTGSTKAAALEAAALKLVTDQQTRVRRAAYAAFQEARDPMRLFAEEFANTAVVFVTAMISLNAAIAERGRSSSHSTTGWLNSMPPPPTNDLFKIFGLAPLDTFRLRAWAVSAAVVLVLAVFGAGVLVGHVR